MLAARQVQRTGKIGVTEIQLGIGGLRDAGLTDVEVRDFTLTGGANGVIAWGGANDITVTRNVVRDNTVGVRFDGGSTGRVDFNTLVDNSSYGVLAFLLLR